MNSTFERSSARRRLRVPVAGLVILSLGALACGGDGTSGPTGGAVASVTVTPNPATVAVGATLQLTATPRDAGGNSLTGLTVAWSSDNTAVATVSSAARRRPGAPRSSGTCSS